MKKNQYSRSVNTGFIIINIRTLAEKHLANLSF